MSIRTSSVNCIKQTHTSSDVLTVISIAKKILVIN